VLFESPRRTARALADLLVACGDRRAAVCRELTKVHQEVLRGTLSELAASVAGRELRGEVTLVVEGAPAVASGAGEIDAAVALARSLTEEGMRKRDAARAASARTGVAARQLYEALLGH
jgi:16S rRNA (cytidine1402-2'-O)-methyltransferase